MFKGWPRGEGGGGTTDINCFHKTYPRTTSRYFQIDIYFG